MPQQVFPTDAHRRLSPMQEQAGMSCCQIRSGKPGNEDPYEVLAVDNMGLMPVLAVAYQNPMFDSTHAPYPATGEK